LLGVECVGISGKLLKHFAAKIIHTIVNIVSLFLKHPTDKTNGSNERHSREKIFSRETFAS
jgi:hypothetical protein